MEEKRKHPRTEINEPAYVSSGGSVMSCTVRNISVHNIGYVVSGAAQPQGLLDWREQFRLSLDLRVGSSLAPQPVAGTVDRFMKGSGLPVRIPVIANGDITSADKARAVLDFTGATGVMLGRAAHGSPWIFRDVNAFLETGKIPPPLLRTQVRDIILEHVQSLYAFHGEASGVRIARKHLAWYCQQHTDTEGFRPTLMAAESSSAQFAATQAAFDGWANNENSFGTGARADEHRQTLERAAG